MCTAWRNVSIWLSELEFITSLVAKDKNSAITTQSQPIFSPIYYFASQIQAVQCCGYHMSCLIYNWRAESQSGLTHKKCISTYHFGNTLLMCFRSCWWFTFLEISYLSLYGMYNFYLIFGHSRQFPIFNMWVRPLWFSALQLLGLIIVLTHSECYIIKINCHSIISYSPHHSHIPSLLTRSIV